MQKGAEHAARAAELSLLQLGSVSYSYLVLKHQMLAHLCPSCFCDCGPLWPAEGGCDWTQGSGGAGIMDGVTSPQSLTAGVPGPCVVSAALRRGWRGRGTAQHVRRSCA